MGKALAALLPSLVVAYQRGELPHTRTARQVDVLAAFVASGGSVPGAAARVGIRPSTAKRHCETTCVRAPV